MKAIIFDMDGVLIDSTKYVTQAFNELLKPYNVNLTQEYRKKSIGRSLKDQIEMWIRDFKISETIDPIEFSKKSFSIERELMEKELNPDANTINLIEDAKLEGIKIGVATSSTRDRAEEILKRVEVFDRLDSFVTAEDVQNHKPDPQIFLKAAEDLGVLPEDCIVFEDAMSGVEAARGAGMRVIAVLTEYTKKEDFEKVADLVINDFSEIDIEKMKNVFD